MSEQEPGPQTVIRLQVPGQRSIRRGTLHRGGLGYAFFGVFLGSRLLRAVVYALAVVVTITPVLSGGGGWAKCALAKGRQAPNRRTIGPHRI